MASTSSTSTICIRSTPGRDGRRRAICRLEHELIKTFEPSISLTLARIETAERAIVKRALRTEPGNRPASRLGGCLRTPYYSPPFTEPALEVSLPEVEAHITGTIWKIEVEVGDSVEEGDTVVILESMKMEMPVEAEDPGVVKEILCEEGQSVREGDTLVVLD
jgi:acetyl-CoA carboxylase biotin carboxyl carrier protein